MLDPGIGCPTQSLSTCVQYLAEKTLKYISSFKGLPFSKRHLTLNENCQMTRPLIHLDSIDRNFLASEGAWDDLDQSSNFNRLKLRSTN